MRDDLFFISLIAESLRRPDQQEVLRAAFDQIETMRRDPRFTVGYGQFLSFMRIVLEERLRYEADESGTQTPNEMRRPSTIVLTLERGGTVITTCVFDGPSGTNTVNDIQPGVWRLKSDTGRVLWDGTLTLADVNWAHAYPGREVSAAADTGYTQPEATREIHVLRGAVVLRVFPGFDVGSLQICLNVKGLMA